MPEENKSYARILKSSSIIAGAQGINMLIGMIRVKFVAILIGPIGVGLLATYQSLTTMFGTVAGLGLQQSAVRDVAQAVANDDAIKIARTVKSLRRLCWLTGGVGALSVIFLSPWLSQITFNNSEQTINIAVLGITLVFANLKGGQVAIIQGMRRIGDLAKLNIIGAVSGTVISVIMYWLYGINGIIPALLLLSLIELIASWLFARKIEIEAIEISWKETFTEANSMVRMGLAFMWNGLLVAIIAYLTRIIIAEEIDMIAVGIYTAAFALSGIIVNFILGAMGADYYPSLTAINNDHKAMCKLVNQQTEIGFLLALPGLLATIAFAPLLIEIFYSSEFGDAANLLRYFALGCIGRVLSWPLGYILLAKGYSRLFAGIETIINLIHIILIVLLLKFIGLKGVSIAFTILYFIYIMIMLCVSRYIIGHRWSVGVKRIIWVNFPIVLLAMFVSTQLSTGYAIFFGVVTSLVVSIGCFRALLNRLPDTHKVYKYIEKFPNLNWLMNK
ncbi:O-antigen translocase [Paraferrimonas sp. SM1919]|uniref:O-antigen translocase n=1 Tax=Paraferrimonas sp. SM1919 TaxID=2662263 RepID=UPI0013D51804|nr:O-antigen translocase [Paraferrimonas sp. SM1919]